MHLFIIQLLKYYPLSINPNIFVNIEKEKDLNSKKTIKVCKYYKPLIEEYKWIPL